MGQVMIRLRRLWFDIGPAEETFQVCFANEESSLLGPRNDNKQTESLSDAVPAGPYTSGRLQDVFYRQPCGH